MNKKVLLLTLGLFLTAGAITAGAYYANDRGFFESENENVKESSADIQKDNEFEFDEVIADQKVIEQVENGEKLPPVEEKPTQSDQAQSSQSVVKADEEPPIVVIPTVFVAEAVEFEPNSAQYVGFKICLNETSSCEIIGVPVDEISKVVLGGKYQFYYEGKEILGAAGGTTYSVVTGTFRITPIE